MEEEKKEKSLNGLLNLTTIIVLVVGILIGALIMYFANPFDSVARIGLKSISQKDLYEEMKGYYPINLVLDKIDETILNKLYKLDDEELKTVKETADYYIDLYETNYGYTKEEFLSENNFKSYDDFVGYLSIDHKRSLYFYDYLEKTLEKDAVKNYYNENAFGEIDTKHILVKTSDTVTDEQALNIANEVIGKLNAGTKFEDAAEEYKGLYPDNVIFEELGYTGAFDNIDAAYATEMRALEVGKYSTAPVKSSFGYHIIFKIDEKEKSKEISSSDKMAIINKLADATLISDTTTYNKALIEMREKQGLKFKDKELKEKYEDYCSEYIKETDKK